MLAPDRVPEIDWAAAEVPLRFDAGGYMDISLRTGVKIWVREADHATRVTMQIHHAACDGTGAYRFVGDLIGCYMKRLDCCAGQVELGEFDVAQLKVRRSKMRSILMNDSPWKKLQLAPGRSMENGGQTNQRR